jgi:hypothetical protein
MPVLVVGRKMLVQWRDHLKNVSDANNASDRDNLTR